MLPLCALACGRLFTPTSSAELRDTTLLIIFHSFHCAFAVTERVREREREREGGEINQSIFYFMSVHIEEILDKNKKQKHIIIIYTNFPTGL